MHKPSIATVTVISTYAGMKRGPFTRKVQCDPEHFDMINGCDVTVMPSGVPMVVREPHETKRKAQSIGMTEMIWGISKVFRKRKHKWSSGGQWSVCKSVYSKSAIARIDARIKKLAEAGPKVKVVKPKVNDDQMVLPLTDQRPEPHDIPAPKTPLPNHSTVTINANGVTIEATAAAINTISVDRLKAICGN